MLCKKCFCYQVSRLLQKPPCKKSTEQYRDELTNTALHQSSTANLVHRAHAQPADPGRPEQSSYLPLSDLMHFGVWRHCRFRPQSVIDATSAMHMQVPVSLPPYRSAHVAEQKGTNFLLSFTHWPTISVHSGCANNLPSRATHNSPGGDVARLKKPNMQPVIMILIDEWNITLQ
jgi:hypothetical protein